MKAVVYSEYGGPDVLRVADIATPTPAAKEVLVQVRAAGLNPVDWHFYRGMPLAARLMTGFGRPRRQRGVGGDVAGTIAALGRDVHGFAVGQSVFGYASNSLAEYMTVATGKTSAMNPKRSRQSRNASPSSKRQASVSRASPACRCCATARA